jgi:hypothetical protein
MNMSEITRSEGAPKPPVGLSVRGLNPTNFDELFRMANVVSASGLAPRGMDRPEQVFVAMAHGLEIGLKPMQSLQRIAVINGRPTIWGDAMIGLVRASGQLERFAETHEGKPGTDDFAAVCVAKRVGSDEVRVVYTVKDARTAGLWGKSGPWTTSPKRMLQMRARAFALRDLFADVLGGLYMAEEVMDGPGQSPTPADDDRAERMKKAMRRVVENTATPPAGPTMAQDQRKWVGGDDESPENPDAPEGIVETPTMSPDRESFVDGLELDLKF